MLVFNVLIKNMSQEFSFKEKMTGMKKCPVCGQREISLDKDFCDVCISSEKSDFVREHRKNYPSDTRKIIEKNGRLIYDKENFKKSLRENESTDTTRSQSSISSGDVLFFTIILFFIFVIFIFGRNIAQAILFSTVAIAVVIGVGFFVWIYYFTPKKREERKAEREKKKRIEQENARVYQLKREEEGRLRFEECEELKKAIRRMPKYENWKKEVFKKYGRKCEVCGEENNIEIHHRQSLHKIINHFGIKNINDAFECNKLWDVDNGSVVCKFCHEKTRSHQYRNAQ